MRIGWHGIQVCAIPLNWDTYSGLFRQLCLDKDQDWFLKDIIPPISTTYLDICTFLLLIGDTYTTFSLFFKVVLFLVIEAFVIPHIVKYIKPDLYEHSFGLIRSELMSASHSPIKSTPH